MYSEDYYDNYYDGPTHGEAEYEAQEPEPEPEVGATVPGATHAVCVSDEELAEEIEAAGGLEAVERAIAAGGEEGRPF